MVGWGGGVSSNHVSKRAVCKNTLSKMLYIIFRERRELRNLRDTPQAFIQDPLIAPYTLSRMTEVEVTSEMTTVPTTNMNGPASGLSQYTWNETPTVSQEHYGNSVNIENATHVPPGIRSLSVSRRNQPLAEHTAANNATWSYCRCAFLLFAALIIT
jgi:hypothetical protein